MSTYLEQSPYLREQRDFPNDDLNELARQSDQAYIDVAGKVNNRTIGIYGRNKYAVSGNKWYFSGSQFNQSLKQVFVLNGGNPIDHGIKGNFWVSPMSYGSFTDNANFATTPGTWYGLAFQSSTTIAGQIGFYVSATQIIIVPGAGHPTLQFGFVVLEYIAIQ